MQAKTCSFLVALVAFLIAPSTGKKPKCKGDYGTPEVENLCEKNWPEKQSTDVYLVVFYTPWCGHCKALHPTIEAVAKGLKDTAGVKVGAIDCSEADNLEQCKKFNVKGYPNMKVITRGKPKDYKNAREVDRITEFVLKVHKKAGSKGGSAKCAKGIFDSPTKDAAVPLCEEHFPDEEAKNEWVVLFYDATVAIGSVDRDQINRAARDLGNEPPELNKASKNVKKQRERLESLAEKYELQLTLPKKKKEPSSTEPLVKFGVVDCSADEDAGSFCQQQLVTNGVMRGRPALKFIKQGKGSFHEAGPVPEAKADLMVGFALTELGFLKDPATATEEGSDDSASQDSEGSGRTAPQHEEL